jgi:hypothetical protein
LETVWGVLQKIRATMPVWVLVGCCILGDCVRSQGDFEGFFSQLLVPFN